MLVSFNRFNIFTGSMKSLLRFTSFTKGFTETNNNNRWMVSVTPFFLVLVNFFLKLIYLSSNSIGGDEPFSIFYAQLDIPAIVQMLYGENNPPLHFFFLHYWIRLFGISEFAVRFPSLIFSSLTVYFIYKIGKTFFNYRIALTAALIFTFSSFHLVFAHEARVYPLFALLTSVSMFYFLKTCYEEANLKNYVYLTLANILLLYAHYFGFFVIFIQVFFSLVLKHKRKQLKQEALYLCSLFILYTPNLYILIKRFLESTSTGTWVEPPAGMVSLYNMLWQFSNQPITTVVSAAILLAALVKYLVSGNLNINKSTVVITIWFLFPFLFMFGISFWIPMFIGRYLVFVSLGYYLLLAICSSYLVKSARLSWLLSGVVVLLFGFTFNPNVDNKRHVRETVNKVRELKDHETRVYISPSYFTYNFAYYYSPSIFIDVSNRSPYQHLTEKLLKENVYVVNSLKDIQLSKDKRVIFLDMSSQSTRPDNEILNTLRKTYTLKSTHPFYEIFYVYELVKE